MKKSLYFAAVLIALGLMFTYGGFAQGRPLLGGYKVIETTDGGATAAADFAIKAESEKDEMEYELGGIAKAERQIVMGSNYRLCMDVTANGGDGHYIQAVVYVDLKNNFKLTSWVASDCGGTDEAAGKGMAAKGSMADRYKPIAKTDAGAELAADFAVKTRAEKTKTKIKLDEIVKAEDREPNLGARDFRLCLKVSVDGGTTMSARAVVSMDQYSNLKLLSWTESTCGETGTKPTVADAFRPIDKSDAGAELAADFAVKNESAKTKTAFKLGEIVKAEDREPALMRRDFRLCLKVNANGKQTSAQAVVSMDQYSNLKLVNWVESTCGGN